MWSTLNLSVEFVSRIKAPADVSLAIAKLSSEAPVNPRLAVVPPVSVKDKKLVGVPEAVAVRAKVWPLAFEPIKAGEVTEAPEIVPPVTAMLEKLLEEARS